MENHEMFPKVRSGFLHLSISFKVGELTCNTRELKQLRLRHQRKRQKSNRLNSQDNNSARAACFFVHFSAVTARLRREIAHGNPRTRVTLSPCNQALTWTPLQGAKKVSSTACHSGKL